MWWCQLQHQSQDGQVAFKAKLLTDRLSRYVDLDGVKIESMIVGNRQWATRNKMQFCIWEGPQGLNLLGCMLHGHTVWLIC